MRAGSLQSRGRIENQFADILGDDCIDVFHSQYGVAVSGGRVDSWTGCVNGIVLPAAPPSTTYPSFDRRPVYAPDPGGYFRGKSIVQCQAAEMQGLLNWELSPYISLPTDFECSVFALMRMPDGIWPDGQGNWIRGLAGIVGSQFYTSGWAGMASLSLIVGRNGTAGYMGKFRTMDDANAGGQWWPPGDNGPQTTPQYVGVSLHRVFVGVANPSYWYQGVTVTCGSHNGALPWGHRTFSAGSAARKMGQAKALWIGNATQIDFTNGSVPICTPNESWTSYFHCVVFAKRPFVSNELSTLRELMLADVGCQMPLNEPPRSDAGSASCPIVYP